MNSNDIIYLKKACRLGYESHGLDIPRLNDIITILQEESNKFNNLQKSVESGRSVLIPKKHFLEIQEKAEKWDKLIESFTFDFQPIDNIPEVARQFIENEIRTTHKLYEENKQLKEEIKRLNDPRRAQLTLDEVKTWLNLTKEGDC